jgi:hypothetical protein
MDFNQSRIDLNAEVEGVWTDLDEETSILVARFLNPSHREYIQKRLQPYQRIINTTGLDPAIQEKIEAEAIARHVLVGWKGLMMDGEELPYSVENALRLLQDPSLSWFLQTVRDIAQDMTLYRKESLEEEVDSVKKS